MGLASSLAGQTFEKDQLRYSRVREAKALTEEALKQQFADKELNYPPTSIFIRALKFEEELEVFVKQDGSYKHLKTYPFCYASGEPGPKRIQGDQQVPEGMYYIDRFNPSSRFYLSLGINYPNTSDLKRSDKSKPGGDIFIHGSCVSIGCIAITDELISELYYLSVLSRSAGQKKIPVHIFPYCMDDEKKEIYFRSHFPNHTNLWEELTPFYLFFENTRQLPGFAVRSDGSYQLID